MASPLNPAPRSWSLLGTRRHTSPRDQEEATRGLEHPRAGRAGRHDCEVGALHHQLGLLDSLLAPLALPTMLTAAMCVAAGVSKGWVMLWEAIAIVLWATVVTVATTGSWA